MPKKKTRKSAAKRFKVTARGKVKFRRPCRGHLLLAKSGKRKRHLARAGVLCKSEEKRVRAMLES